MPENPSSSGHHRSERAYWLCQVGGWGAYGLLRFYSAAWYLHAPWVRIAVEVVVLHGAGMALTHVLRGYATRQRWSSYPLGRLTRRSIVAAMVLAVPISIATAFMTVADLNDPSLVFPDGGIDAGGHLVTPLRLALQFANWTVTFLAWLFIYFLIVRVREQRASELRQSELGRALQLAELRLLKSQLNPHFLFNSLNTIRSLIADSPARAQDAVTRLANTLRYTLNSSHDELVTVAQELEIVKDYLELESMRFEERLTVDVDIPADVRGTRIPVMLLQTVVENAIKHGIAELPAGGTLRIRAAIEGDTLIINVENPRPVASAGVAGEGVGLRNSVERLRLLFGARARLELDLSRQNVATARISIPRNS